jgi:hypothetical protein
VAAGVGRPQPGAAWAAAVARQLRALVAAEAQRPQVSAAAEAPTAWVAGVAAG